MKPDAFELADQLFESHDHFREKAISHRRFKHSDLLPLTEAHRVAGRLTVEDVGLSFEGRKIQMLRIGSGPKKVLFWSQMHGDEPTATMTLLDIFNFLEGRDDCFDDFREEILARTTLYFVPMLNPDGAERYQRATAQGIDMNRDALALQTPEGKILKDLIGSLKPDFGFNLHDQNPRYTAGISPNLATVSFLATSYDYPLSINETRLRSMQLIAWMNEVLQRYIPDQTARFCDDHEPRAFGDNIQKWGTTLILVDTGGYRGDPEKQFVRKLNFVSFLSALNGIASDLYQKKTREEYESIPMNSRSVYDLVIRGVIVENGKNRYWLDIGINREEVNYNDATDFYYHSKIEETGDLSTYYGSEEIPSEELVLETGEIYPGLINDIEQLEGLDFRDLLKGGQLFVRISEKIRTEALKKGYRFPVHLVGETYPGPDNLPLPGSIPTFLLKCKGTVRYSVVNGFVHDVEQSAPFVGNGILS